MMEIVFEIEFVEFKIKHLIPQEMLLSVTDVSLLACTSLKGMVDRSYGFMDTDMYKVIKGEY